MNNLFGNHRSDTIKRIKEEKDNLLYYKEFLLSENLKLYNAIDKQKALIVLLEDKIRKIIEQELESKKQAYLSIKKSLNERYSKTITLVVLDNLLTETAISLGISSMDLLNFKEDKFSEGTSVDDVKTYK
jgi:hypothetical protein